MTDRELLEEALKMFEKIAEGCGNVKADKSLHEHARSLAVEVRKDCFDLIPVLQAYLEKEVA